MEKENKCKLKVKRDLLGRVKEVETRGSCNKEQIKSALKKRNITINEVNFFKKS